MKLNIIIIGLLTLLTSLSHASNETNLDRFNKLCVRDINNMNIELTSDIEAACKTLKSELSYNTFILLVVSREQLNETIKPFEIKASIMFEKREEVNCLITKMVTLLHLKEKRSITIEDMLDCKIEVRNNS